MGAGNSKSASPSYRSSSSSWPNTNTGYSPSYPEENQYYPQQPPPPYSQETPYYYNQAPPPPQPQPYGRTESYNAPPPVNPTPKKRLDRRYSRIADDYTSLDQVTAALARAGLESSNLIIGIDFTKSNEWTGAKSFGRKCLHHIGSGINPYEEAISIIGKTLSAFDEDNLIPCYGFGDASTHDQNVFSFFPDERYCQGFEEVLDRYREIVPQLRLAGPTSFAPVIEMAVTICEQSGGQYHVLLIIADGQVTRSVDTERGQFSPQEQMTVDAIVAASKYPLSIVLVGVGDGPWDMMKEFDDNIPARDFDNFQFVNFTEIMAKNTNLTRKETEFALSALMEIPSQYKATLELNILGRRRGVSPERVALPPPMYSAPYSSSKAPAKAPYRAPSFAQSTPHYYEDTRPAGMATTPPAATTATSSANENQLCPICLTNNKNMAFGCGHQVCCDCGPDLDICPICRRQIETRIRLY